MHTCHAFGCPIEIPPKLFMCKKHWFSLPKKLRTRIWAEYQPRQEVTKNPSSDYLEIATTAIMWLRIEEGKY